MADVFCRYCGGSAPKGLTSAPAGWYSLSVSVPMDIHPRGYVWIGLFCCADHLDAYQPHLLASEDLAREGYDAVIPEPPAGARHPK